MSRTSIIIRSAAVCALALFSVGCERNDAQQYGSTSDDTTNTAPSAGNRDTQGTGIGPGLQGTGTALQGTDTGTALQGTDTGTGLLGTNTGTGLQGTSTGPGLQGTSTGLQGIGGTSTVIGASDDTHGTASRRTSATGSVADPNDPGAAEAIERTSGRDATKGSALSAERGSNMGSGSAGMGGRGGSSGAGGTSGRGGAAGAR